MIKVEGKEILISKFPNEESLICTDWLTELAILKKNRLKVEFKWENNDDILHLYFILSHIKNTDGLSNSSINLIMYYMPYSRMDRSQNNSCFTLKYISNLLNSVIGDEDDVYILEPHSEVTTKLIKNSHRINIITPLMNKILQENPNIDIICYPDKGAKARFDDNSTSLPVIYCEKVRDFDTGKITGLELSNVEGLELKDKDILILDDLCSKGGTFYHTAKKLKQYNVGKIYLGVCHAEETITKGELLQEYKNFDEVEPSILEHIYCLDTMLTNAVSEQIIEDYTNITIYNAEEGKLKEIKPWQPNF